MSWLLLFNTTQDFFILESVRFLGGHSFPRHSMLLLSRDVASQPPFEFPEGSRAQCISCLPTWTKTSFHHEEFQENKEPLTHRHIIQLREVGLHFERGSNYGQHKELFQAIISLVFKLPLTLPCVTPTGRRISQTLWLVRLRGS